MSFLEIACFTTNSALIAQSAGADRVELCDGMSVGGLTPDHTSLAAIRNRITIPVNIMIRPRGGDFVYTDAEFEQMKGDIAHFKALASGFVFGLLSPAGGVDVERNRELVELAQPLPCTFHRAFDETAPGTYDALEDVITCGFKTILTSGCEANAVAGVEVLAELVKRAQGRIAIMPGGSVRSSNVKSLRERTGADWYHSSAVVGEGDVASSAEVHLLKEVLSERQ
jgi:copper homeostasis protein